MIAYLRRQLPGIGRMGTLGILLLLLSACSAEQTEQASVSPSVAPTSMEIEAPEEIAAGQPISVTVRVHGGTGAVPIVLIAEGSFGAMPRVAESKAGEAQFTLDANWTRFAGEINLVARSGALEAVQILTIRPGQAVDPILPLVGPRSIVADGQHWTMVVAVPMDEFGNAVADGTPVSVHVRHPAAPGEAGGADGEVQEQIESSTSHQLAWARIYSRRRAGQTLISVVADGAHSPERVIREVPGPPVAVDIHAEPSVLPADGRQLVRLSTGQIEDAHGNVLLDGTSVKFLATEPDGSRRIIPATMIDGHAYATLQSPREAGTMTVKSWISGEESDEITIIFQEGPTIEPITVAVNIEADELSLMAGPLVAAMQQLVPDGTDVTFSLTGPNGYGAEYTAQSDFGYVVMPIRRIGLPSGQYRLQVSAGSGSGEIGFFLP